MQSTAQKTITWTDLDDDTWCNVAEFLGLHALTLRRTCSSLRRALRKLPRATDVASRAIRYLSMQDTMFVTIDGKFLVKVGTASVVCVGGDSDDGDSDDGQNPAHIPSLQPVPHPVPVPGPAVDAMEEYFNLVDLAKRPHEAAQFAKDMINLPFGLLFKVLDVITDSDKTLLLAQEPGWKMLKRSHNLSLILSIRAKDAMRCELNDKCGVVLTEEEHHDAMCQFHYMDALSNPRAQFKCPFNTEKLRPVYTMTWHLAAERGMLLILQSWAEWNLDDFILLRIRTAGGNNAHAHAQHGMQRCLDMPNTSDKFKEDIKVRYGKVLHFLETIGLSCRPWRNTTDETDETDEHSAFDLSDVQEVEDNDNDSDNAYSDQD